MDARAKHLAALAAFGFLSGLIARLSPRPIVTRHPERGRVVELRHQGQRFLARSNAAHVVACLPEADTHPRLFIVMSEN